MCVCVCVYYYKGSAPEKLVSVHLCVFLVLVGSGFCSIPFQQLQYNSKNRYSNVQLYGDRGECAVRSQGFRMADSSLTVCSFMHT